MDSAPPRLQLSAIWQHSPAAQWIAIALAVGPLYALAIIGGISQQLSGSFHVPGWKDALLNGGFEVLVFGGLMTFALYFICGQRLADLQLQRGNLPSDLGLGFTSLCQLLAVMFCLGVGMAVLNYANIVHVETMPQANLQLGTAMAHDWRLRWIMLGPVAWLQAGGIEEYSRVFVLSRLWRVYPTVPQRHLALLGMSLLFGCAHIWEGWFAMIGTTLIGYVLGRIYLERGRVLPLMIAHALYDTLVMLVLMAAGSGLLKA